MYPYWIRRNGSKKRPRKILNYFENQENLRKNLRLTIDESFNRTWKVKYFTNQSLERFELSKPRAGYDTQCPDTISHDTKINFLFTFNFNFNIFTTLQADESKNLLLHSTRQVCTYVVNKTFGKNVWDLIWLMRGTFWFLTVHIRYSKQCQFIL